MKKRYLMIWGTILLLICLGDFNIVSRKPTAAFSSDDNSLLQVTQNHNSNNNVMEQWITECADCSKRFGAMTNRSLYLDVAGNLHLAYGADHLYYAWYNGSSWHIETLDNSRGVGTFTSLTLDESKYPHITYVDHVKDNLKYIYQDNSGWHTHTVTNNEVQAPMSVLDSSGYSHISYYDIATSNLMYVYQDNSGWHTQTISNSNISEDPSISLVIAEDGYPHISYSGSNGLKYAFQNSSGWSIQNVDTWGEEISLTLDGDHHPHISYEHFDGLRYAYQDGSDWYTQTVDTGSRPENSSLVLDVNGYPHISYGTGYPDWNLKYAYQDGQGWHTETVDNEGLSGRNSSLVLKGVYPYISYIGDSDLKLAYQGIDNNWHIQVIDVQRTVGAEASLLLDDNSHPYISYYDLTDNDLRYVYKDTSGWHITWIKSKNIIGSYSSIAINQDKQVYISYYDATNKHLRLAIINNVGMTDLGVDMYGGMVGKYPSIVLDQLEEPHIVYYDESNEALKYAYKDNGWKYQTVDSSVQTSIAQTDISLAIDTNNYLYSSYCDSRDLKYAYQDASGWHISNIGSGDDCSYTSIALNASDYPSISYGRNELKYAYMDDTGWHTEIVDSEGIVGASNSLAIDSQGFPHISYQGGDTINNELKYAYQDGSGWHIQTVISGGVVGGSTSLALDINDQPYISYYDGSLGDLMYAYYTTQIQYTIYLPLILR